ncbi:MAG TPA: helicase HerA-like domain-containing protein [Gryllotalpicola sp.]
MTDAGDLQKQAEELQRQADEAMKKAQEAVAAAQAAAAAAAPQAETPAAAPAAQAPAAPASDGPLSQADVDRVTAGYAFAETSLELGALQNGAPVPDAQIRIPLGMLNRHGLIAGATGTGKTRTLQAIVEQLSANGVSVFAADIKGDLSGLLVDGEGNDKLLARTKAIGQDWTPARFPTEVYSLGGKGKGVPIRATISGFGPLLLSRVLGLNDTQESSLELVFHYAEDKGLALLDLEDLRAVLQYLTSDEGKADLAGVGGISPQTAGVILRELSGFADGGADTFFGEPEIDTAEFLRTASDGRGIVSLLEVPGVADQPQLYSTFLMWLLADLYNLLPEVGDAPKPKLVFFLDEAHLLFTDASKEFLTQITQTVRLIRSKGVGVFFITQSPKDVHEDVLAQLGSRVQHALRAFTPDDAKALRATVSTYPKSGYDLEQVLTNLGTGEAIVTVMNESGAPTPVAWTRMRAPQSSMTTAPESAIDAVIAASPLQARYGTPIDRESAGEILTAKLNAAAEAAHAEAAAKAKAKQDAADVKAHAATEKQATHESKARQTQAAQVGKVAVKVLTSRTTQTVLKGVLDGIFGTRRR